MNKGVFILGGIIVLAVIAMFAFGFGNDKTQNGAVAVQQSKVAETDKTTEVAKQAEPKVKTETKKSLLQAMGILTPEETIQAFMKAIWVEDYDGAMEYVSPKTNKEYFKSTWSLVEFRKILFGASSGDLKIRIRETEYLDKLQTKAKVRFEIYTTTGEIGPESIYLQKENGIWKVYQ